MTLSERIAEAQRPTVDEFMDTMPHGENPYALKSRAELEADAKDIARIVVESTNGPQLDLVGGHTLPAETESHEDNIAA